MGKTVWKNVEKTDNDVNELINKRNIPRPIALSLASRGVNVNSYESFISSQLKSLGNPYQLPGVEKAAARIWQAISNQENILIYGDYDTDGITSATVLYKVISQNRGNVSCFLPHRFEDGYGFTVESLEKAIENKAYGLIITVDCGITGVDCVSAATRKGIDVIITDHHEPNGHLPGALAVINPKLHKETLDLNVLAGVGVAFKLCHGFLKYGRENKLGGELTDLRSILDLVALGTVADIVPLLGENRILVSHGLKVLGSQVRPGIRALCESVNLSSKLKPSHISFNLAPKLNAAGRFGSPDEAFELLNTDNIVNAHSIAEALNKYNKLRKETEDEIYQQALMQIEKTSSSLEEAITVAGEGWHLGVVGIVASRLAREFNAPAIVLSIEGDTASGSGRSVGDLNLIDLLSSCEDFLNQYGGHPMAAGLSLTTAEINNFFDAFKAKIKNLGIGSYVPSIDIEGDVFISELDEEFFSYLDKLEPFGCCNPEPLYRFNALSPEYVTSAAQKHSKGTLRDDHNNFIDFIAFNINVDTLPHSGRWDVVATPQINNYRGQRNFQLQIKDVRESEGF